MNPSPKISVLMSVYNGERYLREAIDSILRQTLTDFELIIINDGSTDASREIVLSYSDSRIRLLDNLSNIGLTRSLNIGIREARGAYVARMDADDVSLPERLERQAAVLDSTDVAFVGSAVLVIDERDEMIDCWAHTVENRHLLTQLFFETYFIHSTIMGRTEIFRAFYYDERLTYAQDYMLWSQIALKYPVANVNEPLLRYRVHSQSITQQKSEQQRETVKRVFRLHVEQLTRTTPPEDVIEWHYRLLKDLLSPETLSNQDVLRMLTWLAYLVRCNQRQRLYDQQMFQKRLKRYWNRFFRPDAICRNGLSALPLTFSPFWRAGIVEKFCYAMRCLGYAFFVRS